MLSVHGLSFFGYLGPIRYLYPFKHRWCHSGFLKFFVLFSFRHYVSSSHAVIDSLRSLHAFQDLTYPWPLILFSPFHKGQLILAAWLRAPDPWSNLNFATSQWGLFTEHVVRVQRVNVVEVAFEAQSVCFLTTSFYTTTLSSVPFSFLLLSLNCGSPLTHTWNWYSFVFF